MLQTVIPQGYAPCLNLYDTQKAIGLLKRDGYIEQERYGQITLTEAGKKQAQSVRRRHDLLKYFLLHIVEVDEKTAEEDACKMEHIVSPQTLARMAEISEDHLERFHTKPR